MSKHQGEITRKPNVDLHILVGHKDCGMTFHTIARALGYDNGGEKLLVSWKECQKIYNDLIDTTKSESRHSSIVYHEGLKEKAKATRADIVREGLRRAEHTINMTELRYTRMSAAEKNLKRAEMNEQERTTRRQRWAEIRPGKRHSLLAQGPPCEHLRSRRYTTRVFLLMDLLKSKRC